MIEGDYCSKKSIDFYTTVKDDSLKIVVPMIGKIYVSPKSQGFLLLFNH